jgi:hypothetical protein
MSISQLALKDKELIRQVLELYLDSPEKPYQSQIATRLGTTEHNVMAIVRANVSAERLRAEKNLRISRRQVGNKGSNWGRKGQLHPNWKGECSDKKGYLTIKQNGKREFVHRVVMAEALGLKELPRLFQVHHIDGNGENNSLDNLVLCTKSGHGRLHKKWKQLRGNPMWENYLSMILR